MTMPQVGYKVWAIAEGYIPGESVSSDHALISHEAACILNASDENADVSITLFFTDRDPVGPYRVKVGARRTLHLRFNDLTDPAPVPRDTSYASVIEFDCTDCRSTYQAGFPAIPILRYCRQSHSPHSRDCRGRWTTSSTR